MKNFILACILYIPLLGFAQSTMMLPSRIELPKVATLVACSSNETGRMLYRTSDNKAYYCNGLNWQEMTGGGFALPYSGAGNYDLNLFKILNTGTGNGIWAESTNGYGLLAKSTNAIALKAQSSVDYGVYGFSNEKSGVHGFGFNGVSGQASNPAGYGIYGSGINARAGYFDGNVVISKNLTVGDDKGIIQNTSNTQLKYFTGKVNFNYDLAAFATLISEDIPIASFSEKPVVYIADVEDQTGSYYKVIVSVVAVDTNSFKLRFYNASDALISFSGTWNIVAIGPK